TQDRKALTVLFESTGGEKWRSKEGWASEAPLEEWYGITLDEGRVVSLRLENNNLKGE
ncbi:unnamed protein product, partial [Choristocarpus tenellus]